MTIEVITLQGERVAVAYKRCCRVWELFAGFGVGRCGFCKQRPETDATQTEWLEQRAAA